MRIRYGLAAMLTLVAVLALGPAGTSAAPTAAPAENAVVHWSGVAEGAIAAGRPPASSSVLGGMVHGAMYDAVASVEGGLEPFATGVTAPPVRRRMPPSRRLHGTSSSPACRVRRRPSRSPTTRTWRRSRMGLRRTRARRSALPPPPGCWRCGPAITSTTSFRTSSRRPVRVCSSRSRRRRRSTSSSAKVRPFTFELAVRVASPRPARADEQDVREGRGRAAGVSDAPPARPGRRRRPRRSASTPTRRSRSTAAPCVHSRTPVGSTCASRRGCSGTCTWRTADTMIACWEAKYHYYFWRPTHAIQRADTDGNPATTPDPTWRRSSSGTIRSTRPATPASRLLSPSRCATTSEPSRCQLVIDSTVTGTTGHTRTSTTSSTMSRTPASGAASTTARR